MKLDTIAGKSRNAIVIVHIAQYT